MCELFENELEAQVSGGANTWDWYAQDNYSSFSFHWKSGCMIYRRERFDSATRVAKAVPMYETNSPNPCRIASNKIPTLKLKDRVGSAGGAARWVSIADYHEDHFGPHDTCDGTKLRPDGSVTSYDETKFCNYLNMQTLQTQLLDANVKIVAGDQNYVPSNCDSEGYFRCHYRAIVEGQGTCGDKANLGWRDPFLETDPNLVKGAGAIDWILTQRAQRVELMPPSARSYKAGMPGKCFYCSAETNAYGDGSPLDPERISDHTAKFVKVFY
jgi:hypothetical protein